MQALAVSAVKKTEVSAGTEVSTVAANEVKVRRGWEGAKALHEDNVVSAMTAKAVERRIVIIVLYEVYDGLGVRVVILTTKMWAMFCRRRRCGVWVRLDNFRISALES